MNINVGVYNQLRLEHEIAMTQLNKLGIELGKDIDGVYLTYDKYNELLEYKARYESLQNKKRL